MQYKGAKKGGAIKPDDAGQVGASSGRNALNIVPETTEPRVGRMFGRGNHVTVCFFVNF